MVDFIKYKVSDDLKYGNNKYFLIGIFLLKFGNK